MENLFIFIDESGNFDFSSAGTKYFVLTSVSTLTPLIQRGNFLKARYQLLSDGIDKESFHATEDEQVVRDKVYDLIKQLNDCIVDSVVAQKNKANPSLYIEEYTKRGRLITREVEAEFYRTVCQTLLQYVFRRYDNSDIDQIIVVLDAIFTKSKRQIILKTLKSYLKQHFQKPFHVYFHQARADINCQIADYCGWAVYVKNERNELRPYNEIKDKIKSEFPIFRRGTTVYY
ncbi:MAG: DUF3800 domain-containing protein [Patescibacteria group bacterium]